MCPVGGSSLAHVEIRHVSGDVMPSTAKVRRRMSVTLKNGGLFEAWLSGQGDAVLDGRKGGTEDFGCSVAQL